MFSQGINNLKEGFMGGGWREKDKILTLRMCKNFNYGEDLDSKYSVENFLLKKNAVLCSYSYFKILKAS